MPALELAEREVRKRQLIPDNLSIKWFPYDDKCDPSYATISAMDGYGKDCGHVLFGPTCDYALGKYWQKKIIIQESDWNLRHDFQFSLQYQHRIERLDCLNGKKWAKIECVGTFFK